MQIKGKVKDIEELSSKLDSIEEIIGIKKNDSDQDAITRATLAKISSSQKMYMLTTIPNGSPLKELKTTASFGYRIHPVTSQKQFHRGIDLRASINTPVYATADGVVRYVQPRNSGDFGRVIIISHNFGFETVYAHLRETNVKLGDVIKKNQIIAMSGNSGRSTGPHLHYEIRYASMVLNPRDFIDWNLKSYENIFSKQKNKEKLQNELRQISTNSLEELTEYEILLLQKLAQNELYDDFHPVMEKNKQTDIRYTITLQLFSNGAIKNAKISNSSKIKEIDRLAIKTAFSASPYPKPPKEDINKGFKYNIPIIYKKNN